MLCPCGLEKEFSECCKAIIDGEIAAKTPEQLMRSRYSAYATKNAQYIYDTYALPSQKQQSHDDIRSWANETSWLKLNVLSTSEFINIERPTVTFEAIYKSEDSFYSMKEKSTFVFENNAWKYLDGSDLEHSLLTPPKRNDNCLCGSHKKFKKCCY